MWEALRKASAGHLASGRDPVTRNWSRRQSSGPKAEGLGLSLRPVIHSLLSDLEQVLALLRATTSVTSESPLR